MQEEPVAVGVLGAGIGQYLTGQGGGVGDEEGAVTVMGGLGAFEGGDGVLNGGGVERQLLGQEHQRGRVRISQVNPHQGSRIVQLLGDTAQGKGGSGLLPVAPDNRADLARLGGPRHRRHTAMIPLLGPRVPGFGRAMRSGGSRWRPGPAHAGLESHCRRRPLLTPAPVAPAGHRARARAR